MVSFMSEFADPQDDAEHHHHHAHRPNRSHYMVHRHRDVSGGVARAAVFGISDGLVSNVALILGVAAAEAERSSVLVAGTAGLLAGATSMAAGEYVSMKAQAELVERELRIEAKSLATQPALETAELASIYRSRGLDAEQALTMAEAVMTDPDVALEVHAREELGVDPDEVGNPVGAAVGSFIAFAIGALLPLLPWFFSAGDAAIAASAIIGAIATLLVGGTIATFTGRSIVRTALRQLGWAVVACGATWLIGSWLGASIT